MEFSFKGPCLNFEYTLLSPLQFRTEIECSRSDELGLFKEDGFYC